jgi:hypothetical protein
MTASIEEARATEAAARRDKQAIEERLAHLEAQVQGQGQGGRSNTGPVGTV